MNTTAIMFLEISENGTIICTGGENLPDHLVFKPKTEIQITEVDRLYDFIVQEFDKSFALMIKTQCKEYWDKDHITNIVQEITGYMNFIDNNERDMFVQELIADMSHVVNMI